jgi:MFS family permease
VRKLLLLVCCAVFVETAFYAVLAPILPELIREYDLSKSGAGLLAGAYAAGTLAGAVPAGWLAAKVGPRLAVISGLALIAVSSVTFAFAESILVLDVTRFAQGIGGAACWIGGLGWLVRVAPLERRGALIGIVMGLSTVGALCGPVLGGLASEVGTEGVFCGVAAFSALLIVWAAATPGPVPVGHARLGALILAMRDRRVAAGLWVMLIPGLLYGTIYVLSPLRLDELGAGARTIAAAFLGAAALEALVSPLSGRITDRLGRIVPTMAGVAGGLLAMSLLSWPTSVWLLTLLIVVLTPLIGFLWTPGIVLISDGAEAVGIEPGFAFALPNVAWALGLAIGSSGSAALSDAAGDHVPYLLMAALCAGTLVVLWRIAARRRVAMVH